MKNRYFLLIGVLLTSIAIQAEELRIIPHQGVTGTVQYTNIEGSTYRMTATPEDGFDFLYWIVGSNTSTDNPITATIDATVRYTAVFGKKSALTKAGGKVSVTVNNAATPSFDLKASNGSCASFIKWSNNTTTNPLVYQESNGAIDPEFALAQKMKVQKTDVCGTIDVKLLDCGYTLTAQPASGYAFVEWVDDPTIQTPIRDEDYVEGLYQATFAVAPFKVDDNYYLTMAEAEAAAGDAGTVTLVADAEDMVVTQNVAVASQGQHTVTNLTIQKGAKLTLNSSFTVTNLFLQTEEGSSSQLFNPENLNYTNAYFDFTFEKGELVASPDKWYGFSVPFRVDVNSGVRRSSNPTAELVNQTDYLIWRYDGDVRAATRDGWVMMTAGVMEPGRFYMIGIDGDENTWRFIKKSGEDLYYASDQMSLSAFDEGAPTEVGWNAVGNAKMQYADATIPDINFVQTYNNKTSLYEIKYLAASSFVSACPFFVQVAGDNVMTYTASSSTKTLYAPQRATSETFQYFEVAINNDDHIYVAANEDVTGSYTIGKDVARMGGFGSCAALGVYAYNNVLSAHQAHLTDNEANCRLVLYAPNAGEYTISCNSNMIPENQTLYLTENNVDIWNLNEGSYTVSLPQGQTYQYGLRIKQSKSIYTQIKSVGEETSVTKFMHDGQLYIRVNGQSYNAQGMIIE